MREPKAWLAQRWPSRASRATAIARGKWAAKVLEAEEGEGEGGEPVGEWRFFEVADAVDVQGDEVSGVEHGEGGLGVGGVGVVEDGRGEEGGEEEKQPEAGEDDGGVAGAGASGKGGGEDGEVGFGFHEWCYEDRIRQMGAVGGRKSQGRQERWELGGDRSAQCAVAAPRSRFPSGMTNKKNWGLPRFPSGMKAWWNRWSCIRGVCLLLLRWILGRTLAG